MRILAALLMLMGTAFARDIGQWSDTETATWYRGLMQPDVPTASCCGEADAYWCDDIKVRGTKTFCAITDDRPDTHGRLHRNVGEEYEIPAAKLKFDRGNPTGHAIIFLSTGSYVYCFVQGAGI